VSNFYADRLVDLIGHNDITPAVNQIETRPLNQRTADQAVMREHGMQIESWGPVRRRPEQHLLEPPS
jgi:2,5-diketo-D-gluconate reductase A